MTASRSGWWWLAIGMAVSAVSAQEKVIRLRNEAIRTPDLTAAARAMRPQAVEAPSSGLFLVQFEQHLQPAWRQELQAKGVQLLRFVPDDAYVARFDRVSAVELRSLPYIRFVGPYAPRHKVDARLQLRPGLAGAPRSRAVRVLLSPQSTASELSGSRALLRSLRPQSRSSAGTILGGDVTPAELAALAESQLTLWIEPAPQPRLFDEVSSRIVGGDGGGAGTATMTQDLGFDGRGVAVGVADSGLANGDAATMHLDLKGRVDAFFHYGRLDSAADPQGHGTHVSGIIAGNAATGEADADHFRYGLGVAPAAHLVAQRIFDAEGGFESPPDNAILTRDAVRAGAVIGSNSWGEDTQGRYDLNAAEFDALVRDADAGTAGDQPYILEFSVGNAGPGAQTIGSPAVAKNVIATGASQNRRSTFFTYADGPESMADFSSRGPCEDGRIKPDLVAPGTWIASLRSGSATGQNAWEAISDNYEYQGGTSQAGPHVSGAAAVFVQYYRETQGGLTPSPALVKAALINSAVDLGDLGGTGPTPNMDEGWGRVALTNLIGSARRYQFVDQSVLLAGQSLFEQRVVVGGSGQPLKVTLAYTDMPALPAAVPALVNDLDLEVVAPDGTLYRGNQFLDGASLPNPDARDAVNNVEGVRLPAPDPGEYVVRVRAVQVAEDIRHRTAIPPQQDFALVVSGDVPKPGEGVILLDRAAYTIPDTIEVKLVDFSLTGGTSVEVLVKSTSEDKGERLVLRARGATGVFTNSIRTDLARPVTPPDGRLQVRPGDTITAVYRDTSPPAERTATATVDVTPPVISQVSVTNRFSRAVVRWQTDEPASSLVLYGTNAVPDHAAGSRPVTTAHRVTLENLAADRPYSFAVVSTDAAGNSTTNNNRGAFFQITPQETATVLVVDAFQDPILDVPVASYTEPLDELGVAYDVWDVAGQGRTPTLDEIRLYRVVMWRVPEFAAALANADLRTIRDYVDGGGGLFMASMDLLTRLDQAGFSNFRKNVLHVEKFDADVTVPAIAGVENLSITSGVSLNLDYSTYPDLLIVPKDLSDRFEPTTNAVPILFEPASGQAVGVRFPPTGQDGQGRVVFFSFPLDAIPDTGLTANSRAEILRNVLGFLAPGFRGGGTLELDRARYPLPGRMTIEVADSDLDGLGMVTVRVGSSAMPAPIRATLYETAQPGLFRGFLTLTSFTNALGPGQLLVANDGEIRVEYDDTSAPGLAVAVTARVDTEPPKTSQLGVTPDYNEAEIVWETSEPGDSLVQFGESKFLGRTAYAAALVDSHTLKLAGLLADREYWFQVVSRDAAGNATTDDNRGRLYSFRTRAPLRPPFVDGLERSSTNWMVVDTAPDQESISILQTASWELGRPDNSLADAAHGGVKAWGTNLRGQLSDYANTSLVSPAFDLAIGNQVTLRFWHTYDFRLKSPESDILEVGGVYVTTNNGAAWRLLREFNNQAQTNWVQEEIDLTPYSGKVVRLSWAYAMYAIDAAEHPGWLLDDIALSATNVLKGTIVVTNNLAQGAFTLEGANVRSGEGWRTTLTNMPPGKYTIRYQPVPFYQTPPAETASLDPEQTLVFGGDYQLVDLNRDGIADSWEQDYFGSIGTHGPSAANRDSDSDGASDYAEFIAGTNPTNPASVLRALPPKILPGLELQLDWPTQPGHAYQVQTSVDLLAWVPLSGWLRAASTNATMTFPMTPAEPMRGYRVEVRP